MWGSIELVMILLWCHLNWDACDTFAIRVCLGLGSHVADLETGIWVQVVYLRDGPRHVRQEGDEATKYGIIRSVACRQLEPNSSRESWEAVQSRPWIYLSWGSRRLGVIWPVSPDIIVEMTEVPGSWRWLNVLLTCTSCGQCDGVGVASLALDRGARAVGIRRIDCWIRCSRETPVSACRVPCTVDSHYLQ